MDHACTLNPPHVALVRKYCYHGMPPCHDKFQLAVSHYYTPVLSPTLFKECIAHVREAKALDHVGEPVSASQVRCSYHVELAQMDVHGHECDKFAPFSRGLTCGLVHEV